MSEYLNVPVKQIKGRVDSQRLRLGTKPPKYSERDIELIKQLYNKVDTSVIAEKLNMTTKQISDKAYNLGLKREVKRYFYDKNYFEKIDSEDKAYWLGFMYADGNIHQTFNKTTGNLKCTNTELSLQKSDESHLKKFIKSINSNHEVKYKEVKLNEKTYQAARVTITGKDFANNLIDKGCTPRKSLTITFPNEEILPKSLVRDFIRGYVDGDGCLHVKPSDHRYIVNIVGTYDFLKSIREILRENLGTYNVAIRQKGNAFQMNYSGKKNFAKITNYLYCDACTYLERKYEIYQKTKIA